MNPVADDILMHYGTPRHSGRYPWGSGDNPYQRSGDFLARVKELADQGVTFTDENGKVWTGEAAVAKSMGLTTTELRVQKDLAKYEQRSEAVATAKALREKGYSLNAIAEKMGYNNDSSVRSLLNEDSERRMNTAMKTAEFLKKKVDEKGMLDVGVGVERELGVSKEKLKEALYILEMEGYPNYGGGVPQVTNPGKQTNVKVLCPPGTEHKDIYNFEDINTVKEYVSHDDGETFDTFIYPKSMNGKRLDIRYAEDGGIQKDGVIEIRRGVNDLSLGESHYAQVRILVDGNRYLKGMAVYSDDLPPGVDVIFNTNKKKGTPKGDVLKTIKDDPDNPFGSLIKAGGQSYYIDKNGKKQLSLINKRAEEGDWTEWSNKLPSQFLGKQSRELILKQLKLAESDKQSEFDDICSLTNPTVKKAMLKSFADDCDAAAVNLQAAALPRQRYKVILPITSMKDTEVYAPDYDPGEKVALVRYPHGGTFEIPILTVNNKQPKAKKTLGNAIDAIGINSKVAERLSGADFDGDTVMVIPIGRKTKITSTPPLTGLEGFDPKVAYGGKKPGTFKQMKNTQNEMGRISNLITDMTLRGANQDELARAVRHSMVVIDAEKHKLDYKQSEKDNNIKGLKKRYQGTIDPKTGKYHEGASTLLSRAKSKQTVNKRKGSPIIDPNTGRQSWKESGEEYLDRRTGKTKKRTQDSTKMYETRDARTLISDADTPQERAYASYANKMKSLGNQARKVMVSTGKIKYSSSANATYRGEVDRLTSALNVALKNAPRERHAQTIANSKVNAKKKANPDMTNKELKKAKQQALNTARAQVGAKREPIKISDREWEAIQAGAVSENVLKQIIDNTDIDDLRERATPRKKIALTSGKVALIRSMNSSGYSITDIADRLNVSTSVVSKYLKGKR